jgi:hypothetical protein
MSAMGGHEDEGMRKGKEQGSENKSGRREEYGKYTWTDGLNTSVIELHISCT